MTPSTRTDEHLRERFRQGIPACLDVLRMAVDQGEGESADALATLHRVSGFLAQEAQRLDFPVIEAEARRVLEFGMPALPGLIAILEVRLGEIQGGGRPPHVLLIEDDPLSALVAKTVLERDGRRVFHAESGAAARRILESTPIDVVILDLVLPDIDGRQLLIEWTGGGLVGGEPVLVFTAKVGGAVRAECLAYGARSVLEKPVAPELLAAEVSAALATVAERRISAAEGPELLDRRALRMGFADRQRSGRDEGRPGVGSMGILLTGAPDGFDGGGHRRQLRREFDLAADLRRELGPDALIGVWGGGQWVAVLTEDALETQRELGRLLADQDLGGQGVRAAVLPVLPDSLFEDLVARGEAMLANMGEGEGPVVLLPAIRDEAAPSIVVVEDDLITASLLRHRFERSGFEVRHFENGAEAWAELRRGPPDLVVLDVRLPGMDGFEVLKRMRDDPLTRKVRAVMLTGLGREEDVRRAFELGADDYVVKPFSPSELTARILRLLRRG